MITKIIWNFSFSLLTYLMNIVFMYTFKVEFLGMSHILLLGFVAFPISMYASTMLVKYLKDNYLD